MCKIWLCQVAAALLLRAFAARDPWLRRVFLGDLKAAVAQWQQLTVEAEQTRAWRLDSKDELAGPSRTPQERIKAG